MALEGKYIDVRTSSYGLWHKKRYKVLGYDPETDLYTLSMTKVEGPLEHIKLKAENIEVFEETISLTDSESEPEDKSEDEPMSEDEDDEELVAQVQKMKGEALREACTKHDLWSVELGSRTTARVPAMKEALIRFLKTGEKGAKSDYQQKREESSNAMAKFLLLPIVVAITSRIPGFNHKNRAHADRFMEEYRKQHGKGLTRS